MITMDIRITVICENTVATSLPALGEHGFAAFIETHSGNYLFDTGQGLSILHNTTCLKKDLTTVDKIFLSHGHYDHTGGLPSVLKLTKKIKVYAHPDIFSKKYARLKIDGKDAERYIGIKHKKDYYEKRGAQFIFNSSFSEVEEDMYLTGEIPRTTDYEKGDQRLFVKEEGKLVRDPLRDDQSLVLKTEKGVVVILGCAHSGLINTLEHILSCCEDERLYALLGGTHLGFLKDEQLDKTIAQLKLYDFRKIGASHCTGLMASSRLQQEFRDRFFFANVGTSIAID